jgi:hypothetical protein
MAVVLPKNTRDDKILEFCDDLLVRGIALVDATHAQITEEQGNSSFQARVLGTLHDVLIYMRHINDRTQHGDETAVAEMTSRFCGVARSVLTSPAIEWSGEAVGKKESRWGVPVAVGWAMVLAMCAFAVHVHLVCALRPVTLVLLGSQAGRLVALGGFRQVLFWNTFVLASVAFVLWSR